MDAASWVVIWVKVAWMGVVDIREKHVICPAFNAGGQLAVNDSVEFVEGARLRVALDVAAWARKICVATRLVSKTTSNVIVLIIVDMRLCNILSLSS